MDIPTVVVVDDDEELLEELKDMLRTNGYAVQAVSDPVAAVKVIEEVGPYVVLLDLKMKGKSGLQIADELSHNPATSQIPVIAMTGFYTDEELKRLKTLGVVKAFLTKPFLISEAVALIKGIRRLRCT